ncbi:hypothetical protein LOCC1_G002202 [Lachnellula occidentalis]|uniref:Uncharacterized protein n=1 Tax=Lachnellula occidentalis TaxID=215460 RepID=A0A8H8S3R0_9HELO|nr:hypothetical protein LOCC1_G002202 [Lachnellula occidentalis]
MALSSPHRPSRQPHVSRLKSRLPFSSTSVTAIVASPPDASSLFCRAGIASIASPHRITGNSYRGSHSVQADLNRSFNRYQLTAPVPPPTAPNHSNYWSVVLQEPSLSAPRAQIPYHPNSPSTFPPPTPYTFNAPQASPAIRQLHTFPQSSPPFATGYPPRANLSPYPSGHLAPTNNRGVPPLSWTPKVFNSYFASAAPCTPVNYIYKDDLDCDGDSDTEIGFAGSSSTAIYTPDLAPLLGAWNSSPVTLTNTSAPKVESPPTTALPSPRQSLPDVNNPKANSNRGPSQVKTEPDLQSSDLKSCNPLPEQYLHEEDPLPLFSSPLKAYPRTKRKLAVQKKTPPTVIRPSTRTKKLKVSSTANKSVAKSRLPSHENRNGKDPSRTSKSVASASQSTNLLADTVLVVILLVVNLPISKERLRALEVTGDIKSLYILAFPGDNSRRYIHESELGQSFSYFGKTRLLRSIRPGRSPHSDKMAPSYRNQSRRQNRPVEHDIFEGLPVRQWRKEYITIAPPPSTEISAAQNDTWAIELPHGMPKDSHLLPQHSQDLLRAARSGKLYGKRTAPTEEEEIDPEINLGEKPEKKEDDTKVQGYTVKTWKQIPRHMEAPDIEYLAKRRKNIKTSTSKQTAVPTLTKATVKRTDATGAEYLQDVVVPHGQAIEGEVVAQTTIPDPNAKPLDPYAAPTPSRKKVPINRKRPKGPGRGRKKKPAPTTVPVAPPVEGIPNAEGVVPVGPEGIKVEPDNGAPPANNEDVEMGDGSNAGSDDDDEGEEGDDDEGSEFAQGSPAKRQRTSSSPTQSNLPTMNEIPDLNPLPPPTPLFVAKLEKEKLEVKAGSPLKVVALTTSTLTSPVPSPTNTAAPSFLDPVSAPVPTNSAELPSVDAITHDTVMQEAVSEMGPAELPPPTTEANIDGEVAADETREEEEEEDDMLLDTFRNANDARMDRQVSSTTTQPEVPREPAATTGPETPTSVLVAAEPEVSFPAVDAEPVAQEQSEPGPVAAVEAAKEPEHEHVEPTKVEEPLIESPKQSGQVTAGAPSPVKVQPEVIPTPEPEPASETVEDDDDFPDLLGGLEKSLSNPAPAPVAIPAVEPVVGQEAEDVKESGRGDADAEE